MIDRTSNRIQQRMVEVTRENRRRYAFHRMLQGTDRLLWRLEEMNRDGEKVVPRRVRAAIRKLGATMPAEVSEPLRDTSRVQDALDSLFEVQERLFRWRFPDWHDWDPGAEDVAS